MGRISIVSRGSYLLDTHILVWAFTDQSRLSTKQQEIIRTAETWVSVATVWELSIKQALKKIRMPADYIAGLKRSETKILPVSLEHAAAVAALPHHHRDPFDRLLIAQARIEGLILMTTDRHFSAYDVELA
jgi:PIN domain nuclease of toxin-antitoxin system